MIKYQIETKGFDEQLLLLSKYDALANKRLKAAMQKSTFSVQSKVVPFVPVFMGRLRDSIGSKVEDKTNMIVGTVGSSLKNEEYPLVMEFGRKPGTMPPPSSLARWVWLKLKPPEDEVMGIAFVIARNIKARGIKGKQFMSKGWKASKQNVIRYFEVAVDQLAKDLINNGN